MQKFLQLKMQKFLQILMQLFVCKYFCKIYCKKNLQFLMQALFRKPKLFLTSKPTSLRHYSCHDVISDDKKKIYKKKLHEPSCTIVDPYWDRTANLEVKKRAPYPCGQGGTNATEHLISVFMLPKLKMIKSALLPIALKK